MFLVGALRFHEEGLQRVYQLRERDSARSVLLDEQIERVEHAFFLLHELPDQPVHAEASLEFPNRASPHFHQPVATLPQRMRRK